jgi:raffinose/stachyose/melibiose transport system permease protein
MYRRHDDTGGGLRFIILLYRETMLYNTLTGLIVSSVAASLPFAVLTLVGFLKTIPKEMTEAARIDGCSDFKILTKVIAPILSPAITSIGMLNMITVWNAVFMPLLLLSDKSKYTIPLGLLNFKGNYATEYNYMFAGVIIVAIPMIIIYFCAQKKFVQSLAGSVKG